MSLILQHRPTSLKFFLLHILVRLKYTTMTAVCRLNVHCVILFCLKRIFYPSKWLGVNILLIISGSMCERVDSQLSPHFIIKGWKKWEWKFECTLDRRGLSWIEEATTYYIIITCPHTHGTQETFILIAMCQVELRLHRSLWLVGFELFVTKAELPCF